MARVRRQAAVIPYRIRKERLEIALVTTSRGKGWIVPKGGMGQRETARDEAHREAEEKAGVRRVGTSRRLRRYLHIQRRCPCLDDLYLMLRTKVLEEWMEDKLRRRRWMRAPAATARLRE